MNRQTSPSATQERHYELPLRHAEHALGVGIALRRCDRLCLLADALPEEVEVKFLGMLLPLLSPIARTAPPLGANRAVQQHQSPDHRLPFLSLCTRPLFYKPKCFEMQSYLLRQTGSCRTSSSAARSGCAITSSTTRSSRRPCEPLISTTSPASSMSWSSWPARAASSY